MTWEVTNFGNGGLEGIRAMRCVQGAAISRSLNKGRPRAARVFLVFGCGAGWERFGWLGCEGGRSGYALGMKEGSVEFN